MHLKHENMQYKLLLLNNRFLIYFFYLYKTNLTQKRYLFPLFNHFFFKFKYVYIFNTKIMQFITKK